jgi:N-acetylneuraminic acid mutarotase
VDRRRNDCMGRLQRRYHVNTGARYSPSTNTWIETNATDAPEGRIAHAAVWTGNEMIVWGGYNHQEGLFLNTGSRYNPTTDQWAAASNMNAPSSREVSGAIWTGTEMIVWGGYDGTFLLNTGGRYCAQPGPSTRASVFTARPRPTPRPRPTSAPRPCP